jgi:hypothetical protein
MQHVRGRTETFMVLVWKTEGKSGAVESESESEGVLGGVGVGKNVPTPTPTSV